MFKLKSIIKMVAVLSFCTVALAQTVTMQGILRDPLGRTVDDGYYSLTFRIYDAETGGDALWTETQGSVNVLHGVFSAELGSLNSMAGLSFATQYYVGISVEEGPELEPRNKLTTVPSSMAVYGVDNVFPSTGNVGVGVTAPEAGLHIKPVSDEQDLLVIDNDNGGKVSFDADGNLNVFNGSGIKFSDGSTLTSAEMGGSASGVSNSGDVNITSTGGGINFNIGEETIAMVNADGSTAGFGGFDENILELGNPQETAGYSYYSADQYCFDGIGTIGSGTFGQHALTSFCENFYPPAESVETVYPTGKPNAHYQGSSFIDVDIHGHYKNNESEDAENQFHHPYRVDPSDNSIFNNITIKPIFQDDLAEIGWNEEPGLIDEPNRHFVIGMLNNSYSGIFPQKSGYVHLGIWDAPFYASYHQYLYRLNEVNMSDRNVKQNIQDLDYGLNAIMDLRPVRYDNDVDAHPWIDRNSPDFDIDMHRNNLGFIAQELEEVLPEMVHYHEGLELNTVVNWEQMSAVLVKAVQELNQKHETEIDMLLKRIEALENK